MGRAKVIQKERRNFTDGSFVELSIFEVPKPLSGSMHNFKYRLAYIVSDECVMRYDNEAGKGDHKHIGRKQISYRFVDIKTLVLDFYADVERIRYDGT